MFKGNISVLFLFILLTIFLTYPLITDFNTALPALSADPMINIWALNWVQYQLLNDPLNLFNANIYFPHSETLTYSESLIASAIISLPIKLVTKNPITSYNFVIFFAFVVCAWGTYLLVNHLFDNKLIAFFAGAAFSFCSFKFHHLVHLQLITIQWFPFIILYLHKYSKSKKILHLLWGGFFYFLLALSSGYYALFALLLLCIMIPLYWLFFRQQLGKRFWLHIVITGIIIAILLIPFFYPYYQVKKEMNFTHSLRANIFFSCDVLDYLASQATVWGGLVKIQKREPLFPGRIITALLLISLIVGIKRGFSSQQKFYALMSLCAFIFSLGPVLHFKGKALIPLPYLLIYKYIPGFNGLRAPCRFGIFAIFGLVILSCFSLKEITIYIKKWKSLKYFLVIILTLLVLAENVRIPINIGKLKRTFPQVYQWLASQPGDFAIIELPLPHQAKIANNLGYMYYSTSHWKRIVNGCSGYHPRSYNKLHWALRSFPQPESIKYLRDHYAIKYIIIHLSKYPKKRRKEIIRDVLRLSNELQRVTKFGYDYVIEVVNKEVGVKISRDYPHYWLKNRNLKFSVKASTDIPANKNILQVLLNGNLIKKIQIDNTWKHYMIPIRKSQVKYGINTFEFEVLDKNKGNIVLQNLELVK
jgi:hypothetical protein